MIKLLETIMELGYVENVAKGQKTKLVKQHFGAELSEREQKELEEVEVKDAIAILTLVASRKTVKLDVKEKAIAKIAELGGEFVEEVKTKVKKEPKEKLTMKLLNEKIESQNKRIEELEKLVKMMTPEKSQATLDDSCEEGYKD